MRDGGREREEREREREREKREREEQKTALKTKRSRKENGREEERNSEENHPTKHCRFTMQIHHLLNTCTSSSHSMDNPLHSVYSLMRMEWSGVKCGVITLSKTLIMKCSAVYCKSLIFSVHYI